MATKTKTKSAAKRKSSTARSTAASRRKSTKAAVSAPSKKKSASKKAEPAKKAVAAPKTVPKAAPKAAQKAASKAAPVKAATAAAPAKRTPTAVVTPIRIPITNIHDGNDFTAQILVGSQSAPCNVILDTGSSTLAVTPTAYDATGDKNLTPTTLAQLVEYGTGGWAGPVVHTNVSMGLAGTTVNLPSAPIAITDVQQAGNFSGTVDGIMGLAYNSLNNAFDFKNYFAKHKIKPPATYPWSFPSHSFKKFTVQFNELIKKQKVPQTDVDPYFTDLEKQGIVANKFAFYTLRSCSVLGTDDQPDAQDPLNQGFFIMGGGEEQTDLFTGSFVSVQVLHDVYYNTNLKSVQVAGTPAVAALPLQAEYVPYMVSNSIIDSGTSYLALSGDVFNAIMNSMQTLNPNFKSLIQEAMSSDNGIDMSKLDLSQWPAVSFILTGENGQDVTLTCSPQTYWQENFPQHGMALFQMGGPGPQEDQNQSILGLPLMNNYYSVFDRTQDTNGVIRFAPIKTK
jgi:hypothetical protein